MGIKNNNQCIVNELENAFKTKFNNTRYKKPYVIFDLNGNVTQLCVWNLKIKNIPDIIWSFNKLKILELQIEFNTIENKFDKLPYLEEIKINKGNMQNLPNSIFKLKHLTTLTISNSQIRKIPEEIKNLNNLKYLNLEKNEINKVPLSVFNLVNLKWLDLSGNLIKIIPSEIGNLKKLIELKLNFNPIIDFPVSIVNLTELKYLQIYGTKIKKIPDYINEFKNLKKIYYNNGTVQVEVKLPYKYFILSTFVRIEQIAHFISLTSIKCKLWHRDATSFSLETLKKSSLKLFDQETTWFASS